MDNNVNEIVRPDLGIYDPRIKGNNFIYRISTLIALFFVFIFGGYLLKSSFEILNEDALTIFLNGTLLLVEGLIGFYSILYLWHFGRTFLDVKQPLSPLITTQDLHGGNVLL